MKKFKGLLLIGVIALMLVGCGKTFDTDESAVYVKKGGKIIGASVEEFDESKYDKDELSAFIDKAIDEYNKEHSTGSVSLGKLTVENNKAILFLTYESPSDYTEFNGEEIFVGTIVDAMAAGYDFNESYYAVKGTELGDLTSIDKIDDDLKVVILKEHIGVKVDGTIKYISSNLKIKDKKTAKAKKDASTEYTVVIYK